MNTKQWIEERQALQPLVKEVIRDIAFELSITPDENQRHNMKVIVTDAIEKVRKSELTALRAQVTRLEAALEEIRTKYGQVCNEYEMCDHPACEASYGAWAVADKALRATREEKGR